LDKPFLSIVIPAHNEEVRLPVTLQQVKDFAARQDYPLEVILVENGSRDRTLQIAQDFTRDFPQLRVLRSELSGKGRAVRMGMLEARGEYRFMCDADFSMPVEEINCFLPPVLSGYDVAIASREAHGAVRYDEPAYRHLVGRVYNTMIHLLALPGLNDTQCGFKCFRGQVAEELFPLQTLTGWSFDVEVLYIARRLNYQIVEVPIPWYFNAESKVRVWRDSISMGTDLLKIRLNARRGIYGVQPR
jgi:glycosyltransferase involved in cell wall biosynthesis